MKNVLLLICFACCLWSCSSNEDGETTGSIYGVVTLSGSTEPMRAMGVELYHEYALLLKTVTYDDGHYEFDNIQPGNYQLLIVAEGYKKVSFNVVVEAGRTARADMQVVKINTHMTVRTLDVTSSEWEQVSFYGAYEHDYKYDPNEVGFVYAMHSNPSKEGIKVGAKNNYQFSVSIDNLEEGTYYVQAYAKNSLGTEFGEVKKFQVAGTPNIVTLPATDLFFRNSGNATLNGKMEYSTQVFYTEKGFVYSFNMPNPTIHDSYSDTATWKIAVSGSNANLFSAKLSNLERFRTYYVRAYIKYGNVTVYGETLTFNIQF